jgi:hypothetical protein
MTTRTNARAPDRQAVAAWIECVADTIDTLAAPSPGRDVGETTRARDEAKRGLLSLKKQMERLGEQFRDVLHYFLGEDMNLLSDAYTGVDTAIKKLR